MASEKKNEEIHLFGFVVFVTLSERRNRRSISSPPPSVRPQNTKKQKKKELRFRMSFQHQKRRHCWIVYCLFLIQQENILSNASIVNVPRNVRLYEDYNQATGVLVSGGTSKGGTVVFLSKDSNVDDCRSSCSGYAERRCWSFVFLKEQKECYAVLSPGFNPSYDKNAISGVLDWPCRTDSDCSLNGKCTKNGTCLCRPAWTGNRCETLKLESPKKDFGYQGVDGGHHTSSWGAAVLKGRRDGLWHMFASEMTEHCGIGAWAQNSRIIHATSDTPEGPYRRSEVVWEVFSHEPEVVPGPNGEYIMFFTADLRSPHGDCNCCREDQGPCDGSTGPGDCPDLLRDDDGSFMSWASPNASGTKGWTWSDPVLIFPDYHGADTNFAPIVLSNGSLVALWREWTELGSRQFLATASNWQDTTTYVQHADRGELFPDLGAAGTEDQFLYLDENGNYHAVFHHMYGTGTATQWWLDATGGHAFSPDGWTWTYTGVAWGNATGRYNTPAGQGAHISFQDGTTRTFTRLERPHLIFADSEQLKGDPTHLINSAQYGNGTDPGTGAKNDDACYTIIRSIRS